jgi:nitrogen fixation NifU-like protein
MHSERLLDYFENPRNVGRLEPPAVVAEVSNPACGDILVLTALIEDERLADVRYQVRGCTASIAAGSALTELLIGKTLAEAAALTREDLDVVLGGLRNESKHVAALAIDGAKALLAAAKQSR